LELERLRNQYVIDTNARRRILEAVW